VTTDLQRSGLRILIADDDELIRHLLVRTLERAGHSAHGVADGGEALAALQRDVYDLAILDLRMPGTNAIEITKICRDAVRGSLPVLVLTADASTEVKARCLAAGAAGVLNKPVEAPELLREIGRAVAARAARPLD
jgi:two-component system, sensor histidine kinase RpfC